MKEVDQKNGAAEMPHEWAICPQCGCHADMRTHVGAACGGVVLSAAQLQAVRDLWDASDFIAEDTESEWADTLEQDGLIAARNLMGAAFAGGHPIYAKGSSQEGK